MKITVELPKEFNGQMVLHGNDVRMAYLGAHVSYGEDGSCVIEFPEDTEVRWLNEGSAVQVHIDRTDWNSEVPVRAKTGTWSFDSQYVKEEA